MPDVITCISEGDGRERSPSSERQQTHPVDRRKGASLVPRRLVSAGETSSA